MKWVPSAALLMGVDGAVVSGTDFLVDGGVTAWFFCVELTNQKGESMEHGKKRPTAKGPTDWFTGDVYIDAVAESHGGSPAMVAFVHFTPGARTAWHSHSIGQSLYVTEGEGRIQTRGEPIVALHTGDTVFAPGGEWHWHGAAPDHLMTHLAVSEGQPDWGIHVTDEEYRGEV